MSNRLRVAIFLMLVFILAPIRHSASGATIKDTESATHGDEAASYQIVNTYQYPGYRLVQFNLGVCCPIIPICSSAAVKRWWWIRAASSSPISIWRKKKT